MTLQLRLIHVTNENIAPSEVTDNVKDERGDAIRGIPKLRLLVVLEYYLGVPWASPSLGSSCSLFSLYCHLTQRLKTSITQNLTELCEIGQQDKDKSFTLVMSKTRFIIVLTQCLLYLIILYCSISLKLSFHTKCLCIFNTPILKQNH